MTLVRKNTAPYFPAVLDELLNTDWLGGRTQNLASNSPAVNIIEKDQAFTLELAAPGMKKDDFNIELNNDLLSISVSRESDQEAEDIKYTRREFSFASFKRSFTLPESINTAEISATYEDGILVVELPKREEAQVQPARLIDIK